MASHKNKSEIVALTRRILDMNYTEEELPNLIEQLKRDTGCPNISDLIYWPKRPLTAAEIVDEALAYRPVILEDKNER